MYVMNGLKIWYNVDMKNDLPESVKAVLWSYDTSAIDLKNNDHRQRIIENILNRGTAPAVDWLMKHFTKEEIAAAISNTVVSVWSKKSLSLWSLVFHAQPRANRFAS